MTVQRNVTSASREEQSTGGCPHPVSLETIELIEQALAQIVRSWRGSATPHPGPDAGAIEYDSWLVGKTH